MVCRVSSLGIKLSMTCSMLCSYSAVDCITASMLENAKDLDTIVISYDVMCKYIIHLEDRLKKGGLMDKVDIKIIGAIPKFHLGNHQQSCVETMCLNFLELVGRTHGEMVEQAWAKLGKLKYITREMTPGHRKDVIILHMCHHNWAKVRNEGKFCVVYTWCLYRLSMMLCSSTSRRCNRNSPSTVEPQSSRAQRD